jgi:hypothetical protein
MSSIENHKNDKIDDSLKFLNRPSSLIITQRIRKLTCNLFDEENFDKNDNLDIDTIHIEKQPHLNQDIIDKFNSYGSYISESQKLEIEYPENLESQEIKEISDEEFRLKCVEATIACKKYTYLFFTLEKISKLSEAGAALFAIIVASYELTVKQIIAAVLVFFFVTIIDSIGDWGRLREKYAHLHFLFKKLHNSKKENRLDQFRRYAMSFGSDELFIDTIIFDESIIKKTGSYN